ANPELKDSGEIGKLSAKEIFDRDVSWIKEADVILAEVTQVSLGVGYELGLSESLDKKIICLYRPKEGKRLSAMISGNEKFLVKEYHTIDNAKAIIDDFFKDL
ncbi:MAG: nucleoside 2-deoxyribosyltransferase, partial [Candidatus ainarchaeum sp.]|nr:nucleoside 2-deoxyribosyltransferase [Candidatus ainarchaeum sp.]